MRRSFAFGSALLLCGAVVGPLGGRLLGQDAPTRQDRFAEMVEKVTASLPTEAPAKPKQSRKILIYSRTIGFRHSSIEIGVRALTMIGEKTGAYTVDASEDPAVFEPENLSKYDGVFLVSTTGEFLDPAKTPTTRGFTRGPASDSAAPKPAPDSAETAAKHASGP